MTFSIAGRCAESGMLGVAIATSSICVGSRCPWVRTGVGAVATQNVTLPSIGTMVLDRMEAGEPAPDAIGRVKSSLDDVEYRQVTALDRAGRTAGFSGSKTLGRHGMDSGTDCIAAGNLLKDTGLPGVMVENFQTTISKHLAERLLLALEAGLYEAGGEEGPVHSASLIVHAEQAWPLVDLRVDWNDANSIEEMRRLWAAYEPQMDDYVTRALNPAAAPSYGVPGDE